jgi:hypothetical protein
MIDAISYVVGEGRHDAATANYLPYGTRTLRFAVTNGMGRPLKLWLRPDNTPADYRQSGLIWGRVDGDRRRVSFMVHWAGGDEIGACVKSAEKDPLKDKTIKVWEVKPVDVDPGETRTVFLNVTHLKGRLWNRMLTLKPYTIDGDQEKVLDGSLKLNLKPPDHGDGPVSRPVRGRWNRSGSRLTFSGAHMADYVSRWWPPSGFNFVPAGELPGRLGLYLRDAMLTLKLDADSRGQGGVKLAEIEDHDWEPGQDVHGLRPCQPELFHFCGGRYYVIRFWFLWLNTGIGQKHEVPDAERIDVLFDLEEERVLYMGTDFHYKETWGRLKGNETAGKAALGLGLESIDDFALASLRSFFGKSKTPDPARLIARQLCEAFTWQTGPLAHVPTLSNISLFRNVTSPDVREG